MPLLQTKLYIPGPQARSGRLIWVSRPRLLQKLNAGFVQKLTLICAPAGFGKSTLIRAWIDASMVDSKREILPSQPNTASPLPQFCWLSLDDSDNDPSRFWSYVVAALQTVQSDLGTQVMALLQAPQPPPTEIFLTLLLNDLARLPGPICLVLDDYHLINSPAIHQSLIFWLDHLPPQLHLCLASRIDPPLPLARWRVHNQLVEVRADELRFTPPEAATFLNEVMGLTLSAAEITALETRTEGWIAGLQLAALSMQGRTDVTGFIQAFSGSHRHVVSYLVEEVLNRRPEGTLDFLLQTAILEQLTAALCNAVTGRRDSQQLLEKLEQANLFLIPLDDAGQWYRYHHLFAEVLRNRLQQIQPEIIAHLHQRASLWYAAAGQLEQAVTHALAIPDSELAASLIERVALATVLQQSEVLLVRRLVERLPVTTIYNRPQLILVYGMTLALSHQFDAIDALLTQAAPALNRLDLSSDVAAGLTVLYATIARFRGDMLRALTLSQAAMQQLPLTALVLRAATALNMGAAYLQQGDRASAQRWLADTITLGSAGGAEYLVLAAFEELATDQAWQGQLIEVKQTSEQALSRGSRLGNSRLPAAGMAHIGLGEVLYEWNRLGSATENLTQGIQLLQGTTEIGMLLRGYSALARCQWAAGEQAMALTTLQQAEHWVTQTPIAAAGAYDWLAAQRTQLHLRQHNLTAALRWDQATYPVGDTLLVYFQQLTRVRIRLTQYTHEPQVRFLQEASAILTPLLNTATTRGWGSHMLEILMLQALIEQAQGQHAAAQATFRRSLTLAEPAGYLRLFVDEGEPMRLLIAACRAQRAEAHQQTYLDSLWATFGALSSTSDPTVTDPPSRPIINSPSSIQTLVEPLSVREREVLHLIAAGLSNTQIAARLIVTTGTVKTHVNRIFGKLAVQSRTQAIACGRALGLLTD